MFVYVFSYLKKKSPKYASWKENKKIGNYRFFDNFQVQKYAISINVFSQILKYTLS